jgi:hypothetical protein
MGDGWRTRRGRRAAHNFTRAICSGGEAPQGTKPRSGDDTGLDRRFRLMIKCRRNRSSLLSSGVPAVRRRDQRSDAKKNDTNLH